VAAWLWGIGIRRLLAAVRPRRPLPLRLLAAVLPPAGADQRPGLAVLVLAALALGAGAAGSRHGLPGALPATVLLGAVVVLQTTLPGPVRQAWPWNSPAEQVVLGLLLAAVLLAWATRDPAGRGIRRSRGRRPARPRAAACR
jgi:hypothetical protein